MTMLLKVHTLHGSASMWKDLALAQGAERGATAASDVRFWEINMPDALSNVYKLNLCQLTRVHIFISQWPCSEWMRRTLQQLPNITHLGFSYFNPRESTEAKESEALDVLAIILQTAAQSKLPCLHVLALRLTGWAVTHLDACISIARSVDNDWAIRRTRIWVDYRKVLSWNVEERLMVDDARCQRSIWTEAKPLNCYVVVPSTTSD
ncbi:hypothetical protein BKA62DRAFT_675795 [Auriculariales sp. MPI-PUGE-AT-0066]|nr:hypothetical protein BKA62DRAFT_675795 [Auriculariales sp. MPI-PUGE-AT-0066]